MAMEHFAQRLLNPFRGAVHTIRDGAAEAVTADGVHWEIYVANDDLLQGLDPAQHVQISEIRYGSWSAAKGLKRGRLSPSEDFRRMEAVGTALYEHLTHAHQRVPFGYRDHFELWLLDARFQPLALLDSAIAEADVDLSLPIAWHAGIAASRHFVSTAMTMLRAGASSRPSAGDYLTQYINDRAGREPSAQWFRREPGAGGIGLGGVGMPSVLEGRVLGETAFPPHFLADQGHDALHQRLIADFLAWQAPWMLLMPNLDAATRRTLEQQARRRPFVVEQQFRLYPEIIDDSPILAARVEAALRRSQSPPEQKDDTLSTFYIELNPTTDV
jgi:hypothetical protein